MEIALPLSVAELQEYRRRYHEIEARCPVNHERVDFDRARADKNGDEASGRRVRWDQRLDIYGPYVFATVAYLTMWGTFWFLIKG